MKKLFLFLVLSICPILVLSLSGCKVFLMSTRPEMPEADSQFSTLPFKKVVNPAFAEDVANKWVHVKCKFVQQMTTVMDLPGDYQTNYVRFMATAIDNSASSMNLVISKENSDIVFDLKAGTPIDIYALCVPTISVSGITGSRSSGVLIVVDHMTKMK